MPGTQPGPSFIPKRTPTKQARRGPRRMYVFSYIAFILMFGAILTAAAVFIYKLQIEAQMVDRQKTLSDAVNKFDQADLEMVKEFEQRLHFANDRMQHHYSLSRLLTFFETVTAASVQLNGLDITRVGDQTFEIDGGVTTDSFNSTIFQRNLLKNEAITQSAFVEGAKLTQPLEQGILPGQSLLGNRTADTVDFELTMQLDPSFVAYEGLSLEGDTVETPVTDSVDSSAGVEADNQTGL